MNKNNFFLRQVANLIGYFFLQIIIVLFFPTPLNSCFAYIGFFILQPWQRKGLIAQLLLAFLLGLLIDMFYNCPGINAFAAVLLVYSRYYLLYVWISASHSQKRAIRPTIEQMGMQAFGLYSIVLIGLYNITILILGMLLRGSTLINLASLMMQTLLSCCVIFVPIVLSMFVKNLYST